MKKLEGMAVAYKLRMARSILRGSQIPPVSKDLTTLDGNFSGLPIKTTNRFLLLNPRSVAVFGAIAVMVEANNHSLIVYRIPVGKG